MSISTITKLHGPPLFKLFNRLGWNQRKNIKVYTEGGIINLFPSDKFSSEKFVFGGYSLMGFEFVTTKNNNSFIEIGGVGTGAKEDRDISKSFYSNGLMLSAGMRRIL